MLITRTASMFFGRGAFSFPPFLVPPPQKRPDVALSLLFRHMQKFQKAAG